MSAERFDRAGVPPVRLQQALDELQSMIRGRFPTASFEVRRGEDDPTIVHLYATVDVEDTDELLDVVMDRMLELQLEEALPVYVIPIRTPERVAAISQAQAGAQQSHTPGAALLR